MWHLLCQNPGAVEHLYNTVPELDAVEIHEIIFKRDGTCMIVRIELSTFPDRPPARWPDEANAVQVTLVFVGLSDIRLDGWGTTNRGRIDLEPVASGGLRFSIAANTMQINGHCLTIQIRHIEAYMKGSDQLTGIG